MKAKAEKPVIGVAMGDPAGIEPEIVVKDFSKHGFHRLCVPVLIGDSAVLEKTNEELKLNVVLSWYYDRGHIVAKTFDFYGTISVTLGLPFIKTSVDHVVAYEIVGKGTANSRSLEEALKLAANLTEGVP